MSSLPAMRQLFEAVMDLAPDERHRYLRDHCPDDALRSRVERLLERHDAGSGFLDEPPSELLERILHAPGVRLSEFEIAEEIGRGGSSRVFLAKDTVLGRTVALKVLGAHNALSQSMRERFLNEARAAAGLAHPNIVAIHRYGEADGLCYIAMEHVSGGSLDAWLKRIRGESNRPEVRRRIAAAVSHVADAAEHAHRAGVIHRDIKPLNILMDADDRPLLADFGIARVLESDQMTATGTVAGTASYMSPEQIRAARDEVDHRSDVFSLGVVLYEALSGRLPFEGSNALEVMDAIRVTVPPRLRTVDKGTPKDLEVICEKALEKAPRDRYQSAAHLAADLGAWLRGDPILAQEVSVARRTARFIVRNRTALTAGLAVSLVVLAALLAMTVRGAWLDRFAWIRVYSSAQATLTIHRVDPQTLLFEEVRAQAVTPGRSMISVPRGQYRLRFDMDGAAQPRMVEIDVAMLRAGRSAAREVRLGSTPSRFDRRVHVVPLIEPTGVGDSEMVLIPAGTYWCGPGREGNPHSRLRQVPLKAFYIDRYEVSNREYLLFLQEALPGLRGYLQALASASEKRQPPSGSEEQNSAPPSWLIPLFWHQHGYPIGYENHPAVGMSLEAAQAYALWHGKRLPTTHEWEAAARIATASPEQRRFPDGLDDRRVRNPAFVSAHREALTLPDEDMLRDYWGRGYSVRIPLYLRGSTPVHAPDPFPTPLGVQHMFSNASEMVSTLDLDLRTGRVDGVVRGRCWTDPPEHYDLREYSTFPYTMPYLSRGFRCATSVADAD